MPGKTGKFFLEIVAAAVAFPSIAGIAGGAGAFIEIVATLFLTAYFFTANFRAAAFAAAALFAATAAFFATTAALTAT
ncbi:MAG: hypothetical protein ACOYIQ_05765 [Christensenellales bacterium]